MPTSEGLQRSSSDAERSNERPSPIGACSTARSPLKINPPDEANTHQASDQICAKCSDDGQMTLSSLCGDYSTSQVIRSINALASSGPLDWMRPRSFSRNALNRGFAQTCPALVSKYACKRCAEATASSANSPSSSSSATSSKLTDEASSNDAENRGGILFTS